MNRVLLSNSELPFDLMKAVILYIADDYEIFSRDIIIDELKSYYERIIVHSWTSYDIESMEFFIEEELQNMVANKFLRHVEDRCDKVYYKLRKKPKSRVAEVQKNQLSLPLEAQLFPDIISESGDRFAEGSAISSVSVTYERDPKARRVCLSIYGFACVICKFNFEAEFGPIGRSYIHVHHLEPLNQGERQTNPENDLRPVCPNCHAMLHKRVPPFSIEELKEIKRKAME